MLLEHIDDGRIQEQEKIKYIRCRGVIPSPTSGLGFRKFKTFSFDNLLELFSTSCK